MKKKGLYLLLTVTMIASMLALNVMPASATAPASITTISFSADTGTSASDFITNSATQTITATLSGALAGLDSVYGSLDNGGTWTDITNKVAGTTITWNSVTLISSNTLQLKVTDNLGNVESVASQAYVLDNTPPVNNIIGLAFSVDTGVSSNDFITNTAAQTITATLSGVLAGTDSVYGSVDNGITWIDITNKVVGTDITWNGVTLTHSNTINLKVTDNAGNDGPVVRQAYVFETAKTLSGIAFSLDTGISSIDFITNTAAQTITATLNATISALNSVYGSLDSGSTWTNITNKVAGTTLTWNGVTLTGSNTLQLKVTDLAYNDDFVVSQAYVLDITPPVNTLSGLAFSADTGTSSTDFITNIAAQTITATLSGALTGSDSVYGSLDNGSTWTDITNKVVGTTLTWNGVTLTGSSTLKLKVTDSAANDGLVASQAYVLILAIGTTNPPDGIVGTAYSGFTFTSTGGTGTKTYVVTAGTLPLGLALATDGTLSGTPTAGGSSTFTVTATDSDTPAVTSSNGFTMNIATASHPSGGNSSSSSNGTPSTATTIQGNVVDDKSGKSVHSILAKVTTETDGTKTVTMKSADAIVIPKIDGTISSPTDFNKLGFSTPTTLTGAGSISVTIGTDGTIQVKGLANNTEYKFSITYDLGNGQKITIGSMDVKVDSNGNVTLTSSLIDPYGTITDEATGKSISGVNVTLYYANTDRNKAAGKTPDTVVSLPGIDGFNPNNNKNPQVSDGSGAYGFMVFPTSDYYLVGTKDGYNKYTSPTISVEQEIVKWNFAMHSNGTERLAGNNRVDTALAIAKATYSNTLSNVILATSENYTDALSGSVLAFKVNAPILLVGTSTEDQEKVLTYLKSNMDSAGKVYILGGYGAVSSYIEGKITALGFKNIIRLGGADRYETAVKIADTVGVKEGTPIVLVSGESYADAISISSTAAVNQYPIFIVSKDGISDLVKKEISRFKPSKVFIIGSQGAVSKAVEDEVSQIGTVDKGSIVRIGGTDRFETSLAVGKYFNLTGTITCIATGNDFPDALAGSIYAAKNNSHIILVDKALTDSEAAFLQNEKITGITVFGGESVVSKTIEQQLNKILGK